MFEYFYNEIFRRTIISFGSLFNEISIKQENSSGNTVNDFRVPLAYGPTQKFLARLTQSPDLNKSTSLTLPRMSFEFVGLEYVPTRKLDLTQTFKKGSTSVPTHIQKVYTPVPYNMNFELAIFTKLNDDMLQIVEQILPYFQPHYNMTLNLVDTIGKKKDVPVVLNSIDMNDDYEGDFTTRRALIYTLRFSAKTYLYGPMLSEATISLPKQALVISLAIWAVQSTAETLHTELRQERSRTTQEQFSPTSVTISPLDQQSLG